MLAVRVTITEYLGDDPQPGIVACELVDVTGRVHRFIEKTAIVAAADLDAGSVYPQVGEVACLLLGMHISPMGIQVATIDTSEPWGVASIDGQVVFDVLAQQLIDSG